MNPETLPYTLLILLTEFTIGGLWVLWAADIRGSLARSFVRFGAALTAVMALFTFLVAAKMSVPSEVDGYPLDTEFMPPTRVLLAVFLGLAIFYSLVTLSGSRRGGI
ncbi:MAG TPA: hypothetical protein VNL15_02170, partial [Dehalococcoidia bacterium]|nr:hypothetical protein [Dehalococcoidia bacterium]